MAGLLTQQQAVLLLTQQQAVLLLTQQQAVLPSEGPVLWLNAPWQQQS